MNEFLEKLRSLERDVSAQRGEFNLFALFLREDSPNVWDLLVSAPWLDADQHEGLTFLAGQVQSRLTGQELLLLSRIVPIRWDNPGLKALTRAVGAKHGLVEVRDCKFFDLEIKRAYIITADRSDVAESRHPLPA